MASMQIELAEEEHKAASVTGKWRKMYISPTPPSNNTI
jgi:hypothetical protein